ncbi:hypothetical protein A7982_13959 [Minicystis rosea]|nr:hypothetical protein A7982_13959 [Minicystis rosea]
MHLLPDKYVISIGDAKEEMFLDGPTEITYNSGAPKLHTVAGWTAIGGIGAGGAALGLGIYGYVKTCAGSAGCPGFNISKTAAGVLVTTAAVLISISVTGAILFAVTGETITARDLKPKKPSARPLDLVLAPSAYGGTMSLVGTF